MPMHTTHTRKGCRWSWHRFRCEAKDGNRCNTKWRLSWKPAYCITDGSTPSVPAQAPKQANSNRLWHKASCEGCDRKPIDTILSFAAKPAKLLIAEPPAVIPLSSDATQVNCTKSWTPTWSPSARTSIKPPMPQPGIQIFPFGLKDLLLSLLVVFLFAFWRHPVRRLVGSCLRLLFFRGRSQPGEVSGIIFPTRLAQLEGEDGPWHLTNMLRHGPARRSHLPDGVRVVAVSVQLGRAGDDGVKGDKAVLNVTYSEPTNLPSSFFVKFNINALSPMRLLVELSEVCRCETFFYHELQPHAHIPSPTVYYVDYNPTTGEFVLLSELIEYGRAVAVDGVPRSLLPAKHRVRDEISLEEQRAFIVAGARFNAQFWTGQLGSAAGDWPRFEETHERLWTLIQLTARLGGLHHTVKRVIRGVKHDQPSAFLTWDPPTELIGRESELIHDMPLIMRSLCQDKSMVSFGHNDIVLDNAYFWRSAEGALEFGLFDWQQSCLNNVGQEWAWNLHFLLPEFLTAHEDEFISLILETYSAHGVHIPRARFLRAYVLGTVQMYVFGGAGLQQLLSSLHGHGLFEDLQPNDARCRLPFRDSGLTKALHEKLVGAEMTRRTFTNVCNIMRRHNFVGEWAKWKQSSHISDSGSSSAKSLLPSRTYGALAYEAPSPSDVGQPPASLASVVDVVQSTSASHPFAEALPISKTAPSGTTHRPNHLQPTLPSTFTQAPSAKAPVVDAVQLPPEPRPSTEALPISTAASSGEAAQARWTTDPVLRSGSFSHVTSQQAVVPLTVLSRAEKPRLGSASSFSEGTDNPSVAAVPANPTAVDDWLQSKKAERDAELARIGKRSQSGNAARKRQAYESKRSEVLPTQSVPSIGNYRAGVSPNAMASGQNSTYLREGDVSQEKRAPEAGHSRYTSVGEYF